MIIHLDMDGVLCDFVGGALDLFRVRHASAWYQVKGWDDIPRVISDHTGRHCSQEHFWRTIGEHGKEFWRDLDPLPWRSALLKAVGPYTVIVSSPAGSPGKPAERLRCKHGKIEWLHLHAPEMSRRVCFLKEKDMLAGPHALLIDDGEHNVEAYNAKGAQTFLFPAPWNTPNYNDEMPWEAVDKIADLVRMLGASKAELDDSAILP